MCDAGVRDQRGADLARPPGQEREHPGGQAAGPQRLDQALGAPGRLLGRLEHDGVAGRQRRRGHPAGMASGKFHGAITAATPARR